MYCELCKRKPRKRMYQCDVCEQPVCDQCQYEYKSKCGLCKRGNLK